MKEMLQGLTTAQVTASRREHGANLLTPPKREPVWKLFIEKFEDPVIRVLLVAAFLSLLISFVHQEFAETIGIFCAIFLATGVGFWFEWDAGRKFDLLNQTNDEVSVKVMRNGQVVEVPRRDVVVGDVVLLETGEEVPADGHLVEATSMSVNESSLTGEPVVGKTVDPAYFEQEATYASNRVLRGTTVVEGHGVMVVEAVGDATEFGEVAEHAAIDNHEKTPLNQKLERLAKFIGVAGFTLAFLTFWALFLKDILAQGHSFTPAQYWTLGSSLLALGVMSVRVWLPIVYDARELLGKSSELPRFVTHLGWMRWILFGIAVFVGVGAAGYLCCGIDLLNRSAWISLDEAQNILQYFMVAVTLIVVAVPEGLPMSVTLSLALSMRRMLKTNNLVRKMHACETMGAATVICTDKTGTLTQNQMQVSATNFYSLPHQTLTQDQISDLIAEGIAANTTAYLSEPVVEVSVPTGKIPAVTATPSIAPASVNSGREEVAVSVLKEVSPTKGIGNPTEVALLLWLKAEGINYLKLRTESQVLDQWTFTTERKFMATLVSSSVSCRRILYVKGAPEIVLGKSAAVLVDGAEVPVAAQKPMIEAQLLGYQNQAMRTLGFAYAFVDDSVLDVETALQQSRLIYLGIAAISDPVRGDVPAAVRICLDAGIAVKIVTGDTPGTAREIARQIGLWTSEDTDRNHLTGVEFAALSDAELLERVGDLKVMSRARPLDKQRLVRLLQQRGEVVAVTGDGTNDAPALNFAHVGLSMGTGTSVAKEASDITLLDDSFNSIATAVMWGRSLYRNIQRFVVFQLTINFVALIIVFLGSLFGTQLPLTVTQMLWVNLIMDTFAAGALASLPPNPSVMKESPRSVSEFIITPAMRRTILGIGVLFVGVLLGLLSYYGSAISRYDLSLFFTTFVMLQFWNLFNAKAFGTYESAFKGLGKSGGFLLVLLLILVGQFLIVTYGGEVFRTEPLRAGDWVLVIGATSFVLWLGELSRLLRRARN